jgi:ComF family protein
MHQLVEDSFHGIAHLLFPHCCIGCNAVLEHRKEILCYACSSLLPRTNFENQEGNPLEKSFYGRIPIESATAAFYFSRESILHQLLVCLKYKQYKEVGWFLGRLLGYQLAKAARFQEIDIIFPLPLHPNKLKIRGYNQAALIAEGIQSVWPKKLVLNAAIRTGFSESQTVSNRVHRWQKMQGVFQLANQPSIQGKRVLLIDDVATTGATLEACGSALLLGKPASLSIATVAYAL